MVIKHIKHSTCITDNGLVLFINMQITDRRQSCSENMSAAHYSPPLCIQVNVLQIAYIAATKCAHEINGTGTNGLQASLYRIRDKTTW